MGQFYSDAYTLEWATRADEANLGPEAANSQDQPTPGALDKCFKDPWGGFANELATAFHSLVEETSQPERYESAAAYERVYYLVRELCSNLPFCEAVIEEGTSLYRARSTSNAESEEDLSYAPNPTRVRSFGRANAPEESIFYCANDARTAVAEVLYDWFGTAKAGETRRVFVGRWLVARELKVAAVPYHEEALALSPSRHQMRRHLRMLRQDYAPETWALVRDCFAYLASEYARPAGRELDYWVSTAYFKFATNPGNFKPATEGAPMGLLYPSVQMKFYGDNFATFPQVVDEALRFIDAQAMEFRCLGAGRFNFEGRPPRWFSKRSHRFKF